MTILPINIATYLKFKSGDRFTLHTYSIYWNSIIQFAVVEVPHYRYLQSRPHSIVNPMQVFIDVMPLAFRKYYTK